MNFSLIQEKKKIPVRNIANLNKKRYCIFSISHRNKKKKNKKQKNKQKKQTKKNNNNNKLNTFSSIFACIILTSPMAPFYPYAQTGLQTPLQSLSDKSFSI